MRNPLFRHPRPVLLVVALIALLGSALLAWERREGMLSRDEMAYRFQAHIFEGGKLVATAPPGVVLAQDVPKEIHFAYHLVTPRGWYGMYPLGWPLVLAAGGALHIGWLTNPLLGVLLVWLTWRLGSVCFSEDVGLVSALLLFPCPFFFINTSGDLSHPLAACIVTAALCLVETGVRRQSIARLVLAVGLLGLSLFVRPFTAVAAAATVGLVLVFRLRRDRLLLSLVPWAIGALAATIALMAAENVYQTGSVLKSGYALYAGKGSPPEVTLNLHAILAASPREAARSLAITLLNTTPFLFVLAGYALFRAQVLIGTKALLVGVFTGSVLLYMLDVIPNILFFGQRMYFEGLPGIAVLAGAGLVTLLNRWKIRTTAVPLAAVLLGGGQLAQYWFTVSEVQALIEPSVDYLHVLRSVSCSKCVVFLRSENLTPFDNLAPANFNVNDPDWPQARHLYLIDPGPSRRDEITRKYRRGQWAVVVFDGATRLPRIEIAWRQSR